MDIHINEGCHKELAIKTIHDTPMSRNDVTKVLSKNSLLIWQTKSGLQMINYLDFKSSFKATSEKSTKRSNNRSKNRHEEGMKQEWIEGYGLFHLHLKE